MEVKSKRERQSERTREALLREGTKLFAKRGYDGTFIEEVARRARVTKGALYHQFRDKLDLFEAVVEARVTTLIRDAKRESRVRVEARGVSRKSPPRYLEGVDVLIDGLCDPANRRILLLDGPVALGRERWNELWGRRMLDLVRGVFRDSFRRGVLEPELVDPLSHMLYGALQETALAIGHSADPEAARRTFGAAAHFVVGALLRSPPAGGRAVKT